MSEPRGGGCRCDLAGACFGDQDCLSVTEWTESDWGCLGSRVLVPVPVALSLSPGKTTRFSTSPGTMPWPTARGPESACPRRLSGSTAVEEACRTGAHSEGLVLNLGDWLW